MIQSPNMQMPMQQVPQQGGGANAVAINIYNPQAYGSTPTQQAPYQAPQAFYNIPYNSVYGNYTAPAQQPQFTPEYVNGIAIPQQWQHFMPVQNIANTQEPQFVAPAPQAMPQSVMTPAVEATPVVEQAPAQVAQAEVAPVEIVEPQQTAPVVDIDSLVQGLKNADSEVKAQTINQIAAYAQEAPEVALQVVSEPIMQSLVDIIKEDTTGLQGPTQEQIAVAEKVAKGEQLTEQENALAEQLSPRDMANKNRMFALYTLAMVQKLQRDELNQYIESQKANGQEAIAPLNVQDLVGYNDVINVIQNDARPELKVAALQALNHVVEPQDKATVEPVLAEAQKSTDEAVKTAATEIMAKFSA